MRCAVRAWQAGEAAAARWQAAGGWRRGGGGYGSGHAKQHPQLGSRAEVAGADARVQLVRKRVDLGDAALRGQRRKRVAHGQPAPVQEAQDGRQQSVASHAVRSQLHGASDRVRANHLVEDIDAPLGLSRALDRILDRMPQLEQQLLVGRVLSREAATDLCAIIPPREIRPEGG